MKELMILGTVVTEETAPGFMKRIARMLLNPVTMGSSAVLTDIEKQLIGAGLMTAEEAEEIECAVC